MSCSNQHCHVLPGPVAPSVFSFFCVWPILLPTCLAGDVAQWLETRKSNPKTQGSIPWWGKCEGHFFLCSSESTLVCTRQASFVCTARTQMCAHVKDPIYICRKRVGLTAGGIET